jgi:hypothetical protein
VRTQDLHRVNRQPAYNCEKENRGALRAKMDFLDIQTVNRYVWRPLDGGRENSTFHLPIGRLVHVTSRSRRVPPRLSSLISGMNPDLARRMLRSAYHEFRDALRTEYRASWLKGRCRERQPDFSWSLTFDFGGWGDRSPSKRIKDAQSPVDKQSILKILR